MIGTSSADIRLSEILQVEGEIIPPRDLTIKLGQKTMMIMLKFIWISLKKVELESVLA